MYEFFSSVWRWVLEHSTEVITFLSSSAFVTAATNIVLSILQRRGTKENTTETRKLSALMKQNEKLVDTVDELKAENSTLSDKLTETLDTADNLLQKVNALLEVEYVRANAISNAKTRTNVSSIINNVKYAETRTRAKIAAENEELKRQIAEFAETAAKSVDAVTKMVAVDNTASEAETTTESETVVLRG